MIKRIVAYSFIAAMMMACGSDGDGGESADAESANMKNEATASGAEGNIITTASGLQYEILQQGTGDKPNAGDLVSVHYTGTLKSNGEKFDSSLDRGEPISFPVGTGRVIPGWDEGIMLLNKGAKARLTIPANLAYGAQDRPGIPANSVLVFEVEMMDITKPEKHEVYKTDGLEKKTTASGLEYYIIEEGTGAQAKAGDAVSVHYYGYFKATGERFDDSYSRGQPFQFPLGAGRVIPGWDEGLALLKEGAKAKLVIPYNLAYGEAGSGPIPPKSDLVFDVWLKKLN